MMSYVLESEAFHSTIQRLCDSLI